MKENKKDVIKRESICYLEILIMIVATFAFAYLVAIPETKLVSAEMAIDCCIQTKNGQYCQELPYTNCSSQCNSICQHTSCSNVAECELGCCIDNEQGNCIPNTPLTLCKEGNVEWKSDASCNYEKCKSGCCVLGDKTAFVNSRKCEILTSLNGLSQYEFYPGETEAECISREKSVTKGACLFIGEETNCKITTKDECVRLTGSYSNFYENYLCTAPELNTTCKPTTNTTCVDGKDEVYFIDTCGNIANIYDSSKVYNPSNNASVEYWKRIFSKNESCSSSVGNINSKSCGNCDYLLGSRCNLYRTGVDPESVAPDYGDYICRDLNCYHVPLAINTKGDVLLWGDKKQGESWCIYENLIGNVTQQLLLGYRTRFVIVNGSPNIIKVPIIESTVSGTDPVGSRHYIAQCLDGNFSISPCDEYRNNICVQSDVVINNETNETFSFASCRVNAWQECLEYNYDIDENTPGYTTNDKMNECIQNPDCYVKQINIDKYFKFPYCLPKYKPAFDLTRTEGDGKPICALASQTCEVVYQKTISGWKCIANCDCRSKEFTLKMNEWCRSLGDCGAQVNVAGEVTTGGFRVSGAPKLIVADFKDLNFTKFISPELGKVADPGNLTYFFKKVGIPADMAQPKNLFSSSFMGGIIGAAGITYALASWVVSGINGASAKATTTAISAIKLTGIKANVAPYLEKAFAALAGAAIGYMLGKAFGLSEEESIALAIIGAIVSYLGVTYWSWNPVILVGIAIILTILSWLFGIGEIKTKYVTATCLPYERPVGGDNCDLCNQNKYLECNRYKCTSLGSACKFINEGTPSAKCIASTNDHAPPILAPLKFTENYTYNEFANGYEIKDKNGQCFEEWSDVNLGVTSTNKISQCKIETKAPTSFDSMLNYFPDTLYDYNHSMIFKLPSANFLGAIGFDPSRTGEMRFYVRCQDDWGNKNPVDYVIKTCVKPGPDKTPALINKFSPEQENAYLGFEKTNFSLTIYTNEPAECKYSFSDKNYEEMENNFACGGDYNIVPLNATIINNNTEVDVNLSEIEQTSDDILMEYLSKQTIFGFPCYTNVNVVNSNSTIFIRCLDQPWYKGTNESLRNANQQSQPPEGYQIKLSSSALNITSILPSGKIMGGVEPFTIDLEAETSGGANDKATCYYSFDNSIFSRFKNTDSTSHSQSFNQMITGDYVIYVKCVDIAGNIATAETSFSLEIDTKTPKVIRAYSSSGILHIITDEDSECAYSTKSCNFIYDNETKMDGYGKEHTTSIISGKTYYIKCKDLYNNLPGGCSIKVEKIQ